MMIASSALGCRPDRELEAISSTAPARNDRVERMQKQLNLLEMLFSLRAAIILTAYHVSILAPDFKFHTLPVILPASCFGALSPRWKTNSASSLPAKLGRGI